MQPIIGTIYLLTSENNKSLVYFGSTMQKLNKRLSKHKSDKRCSCTSYKIIECGKPIIKAIEEIKIDNKDDLPELKKYMKEQEKFFIETFECVNKNIPTRTKTDYMNNYYYPKKKEELLKPVMCECGKITSKQHIKRHQKSKHHLNYLFNKKHYKYIYNDHNL